MAAPVAAATASTEKPPHAALANQTEAADGGVTDASNFLAKRVAFGVPLFQVVFTGM